MDFTAGAAFQSRKRGWEESRGVTQAFSSPKRPISNFSVAPWPGVTGAFLQAQEYSKWKHLSEFAWPSPYDVDPFIPADEEENPVTQDVWLNTCTPLRNSTILGDGRLLFKFTGIDKLRRISRRDPFGTVERVSDTEVFVKGFTMGTKDHAYREELLRNLMQDYQVPATDQPPYGGLVACVTFAELKAHITAYAMRVGQLRQTVLASKAEQFGLADHQETIYGWSRPTTVSGGSQAAAGVEALLSLCMGPRDLYDLFRPMGISFTGKREIDAESELLTVLSGGCAKMLITSMDDAMCKRGESAPFSLWLVYQQKHANVVESANRHLDNYPDVDLVITNKPKDAFLEAFMANTGNASYSSRDNPRSITPFIFVHVAMTRSCFYPHLNDETDVYVTLAEKHRPIILFPPLLKSR